MSEYSSERLAATASKKSSVHSSRMRAMIGLVCAILLAFSFVGASTESASASGYKVTPAPGGCVNQSKWVTSYKTGSYEKLYVATVGQCATKANSCRYGLSVWYTDMYGKRRNVKTVNDGCTWSPYWWLSTPYFRAKRGTNVQVTFRWDGTWYNGFTFRIG